jgi:hypothetical protein
MYVSIYLSIDYMIIHLSIHLYLSPGPLDVSLKNYSNRTCTEATLQELKAWPILADPSGGFISGFAQSAEVSLNLI